MSSKESKEFMRLIKASFDTSSYAIRNFITSNVIPNGKTFSGFLDDLLHDLYHKYQNQLPCCFPGCENQQFPKQQKIFQCVFFQLYEFTKGPFSCKNRRGRKTKMVNGVSEIIRYCSCNVNVVAHIKLQNLDISILNRILQETGNSNLHVAALCDARNKICHVPTTTSLSHKEYIDLWTIVETEVLKLADHLDPSVKDMIRDQLELIPTWEIDEKTTEVLMKKLEEAKLLLKNNQDKNYAGIINHVSQCIGTTNAQVQSSTQNIIKSQNENTCRLLKSENESTSQLLMSQNDLKSKLVETQKELQKNTDRNTEKVCQTVTKTNKDLLTNVATRKQGENIEARLTGLEDLMKVLIERDGCRSFHLQARPSDIRTQSSSESVPGNRDIQMTCTVAQPSLTKEMEQNIIESLPNEIDVTIDEENDEDNSKQTLKIKSKKVNSIVLEIHATCKIFQSPSELRSAICALVEMVLNKGEVDRNAEDPILVTLSFESILTEDEKATVINLLTTKYELINEEPNARPKNVNAEEMIEENDIATHLSEQCLVCLEKDEYINQLEERYNQLERFVSKQDTSNTATIQKWVNQGETPAYSDSGEGRSDYSASIETLSDTSVEKVHTEKDISASIETLSDTSVEKVHTEKDISGNISDLQIRWIALGICLHSIISPVLRTYASSAIIRLYNAMTINYHIDTQTYQHHLQRFGSEKILLNYENINNNRKQFGRDSAKYDYRVLNAVDMSKLFVPRHVADYSGFDETWDVSVVLNLIRNMDIFPTDVQCSSRKVMVERNMWAHCDSRYDLAKFDHSIKAFEEMVHRLLLPDVEETAIIQSLNKWRKIARNKSVHDQIIKDIL